MRAGLLHGAAYNQGNKLMQQSKSNRGSSGGKATAAKLRAFAREAYAANPKHCRFCHKVILLPLGIRPSLLRKTFCDSSCAASFNNRGVCRRVSRRTKRKCEQCMKVFVPARGGKGQKQRFCSRPCADLRKHVDWERLSKGELFARYKTWQTARSVIQSLARAKVLSRADFLCCVSCGYTKHVEVAHRRAVSAFPDTALLAEINALTNLVPLCPTHHWEQEHGHLLNI